MLYYFIIIVLFSSNLALSQDKGYRFKNGYCHKDRVLGLNPNFRGECGMYTGARIINDQWEEQKLTAINLNGSFIYRSHFNKIDLRHGAYRRGHITESTFNEVEAQFLDFRGSWMKGSTWTDSNLYSWIASGARIEKTTFKNCDLRLSTFWGANLQESDFSGSDLRGANLQSTYILFTKFEGAKFNSKTLLPFSREEALKRGMVEVD